MGIVPGGYSSWIPFNSLLSPLQKSRKQNQALVMLVIEIERWSHIVVNFCLILFFIMFNYINILRKQS